MEVFPALGTNSSPAGTHSTTDNEVPPFSCQFLIEKYHYLGRFLCYYTAEKKRNRFTMTASKKLAVFSPK